MGSRDRISGGSGESRCEGPSVQTILEREKQPVPDYLRDNAYAFLGDEDLPVARWVSRDFHTLEMQSVWSRTWQMACREEDVPEPGDYVVYDIGNRSVIVVRSPDGAINAFHNSCLHRGTQLCAEDGSVGSFRCPFHGWTWELDGTLQSIPCRWDFPHVNEADFQLPRVRVGTWGGFVFVNFDHDAMPLEDYLSGLDEAFARYPLGEKYKATHISKVVPCNWKIALEAFIESYHVIETHPQILPYVGDANTQYNIWDDNPHISRMHVPHSFPSPHNHGSVSEQDVYNAIQKDARKMGRQGASTTLPDGATAREVVAARRREMLEEMSGQDFSWLTDAETLDTIQYFIFPNMMAWTAFGAPSIYRFRPNGDDHETSIMDVMQLWPYDKTKGRPEAAKPRYLSIDQKFAEATELGGYGEVFDQDGANMPLVHRGLKASEKGTVTLANYEEVRVRHFHQTIDKYISGEI